jgi:hypothetical protein
MSLTKINILHPKNGEGDNGKMEEKHPKQEEREINF